MSFIACGRLSWSSTSVLLVGSGFTSLVGVPGLYPSALVLPVMIFSGLVPLVRAFSLGLSDSLEDFIRYVLTVY